MKTDVNYSRRFRFSLRVLLTLVLVICCGLGWLAHERRSIAERRQTLEAAGVFEFENLEEQPAWRQLLLGDDWPYFAGHITVHDERALTESTCAAIGQLSRLRELRIAGCPVTAEGVANFQGLKSLRILSIDHAFVTDDVAKHLGKLESLEELMLSGSITDLGLSRLCSLRHLRRLQLHSCPNVTDVGIGHLANIETLRELKLENMRVAGAAVSELVNLEEVDVSDCPRLYDSRIAQWDTLTRVKHICFFKVEVTPAAIEQLQRALPACHIDYNPKGVIHCFAP